MTREDIKQAAVEFYQGPPVENSVVEFAIEQVNRALDEAADQILDPWCHQKIRALKIK